MEQSSLGQSFVRTVEHNEEKGYIFSGESRGHNAGSQDVRVIVEIEANESNGIKENGRNENEEWGEMKIGGNKGSDNLLDVVEEVEEERNGKEEQNTVQRGEDEKDFRMSVPRLAEPEASSDSDLEENLNKEKFEISLMENEDPNRLPSCKECFEILDRSFQLHNFESDLHMIPEEASTDDKNCYTTGPEGEISPTEHDSMLLPSSKRPFCSSRRSIYTSRESLPTMKSCHASRRSLTLDLECRICHDNEGQDLISPCHCAGTSKWVHESCIIRWIRHAKSKECEICTCPIKVKRKKKPIDQWTRPSATCGPCNKLDIWYCFVVVLCLLIIISFVILQQRYDVSEQLETTVIFASIYVLCGMIIMMKIRYFWNWFTQRSSFWGNWKNLNEEWRIIEAAQSTTNTPNTPISPV